MRIHLGHHFYGAGNVGDDFMLGGFLVAMASAAPGTTFSLSTPFPLEPMRRRFPQVEWLGYTPEERTSAIAACDAWVGLGGSPFQSAQSRWFIDHLVDDAARCRDAGKPMYFLGVGVQEEAELLVPDVRAVCGQAEAIWTRDAASAHRLGRLIDAGRVRAAADLAHVLLAAQTPRPCSAGTTTLVLNFDHRTELTVAPVLAALDRLPAGRRFWLAQESRALPGAERDLFQRLPDHQQQGWEWIDADVAGARLDTVLERWPATEWLVTSRFHAAIAGAWNSARVLVLATNEKLRGVAEELNLAVVPAEADAATIEAALRSTVAATRPVRLAELARSSVHALVSAIRRRSQAP